MDYGWHFFCSWVSALSVSLNNCCNTANTGVKVNFYCKKVWECLVIRQNVCTFASQLRKNGALSERLGTGLQNHSRRFDSATHLKAKAKPCLGFAFFVFVLSYPIQLSINVSVLTWMIGRNKLQASFSLLDELVYFLKLLSHVEIKIDGI